MNFLTVTHFFEAHGGGIEKVAGRLVREFAALGHASAWLASSSDPAPAEPGLSTLPIACINPTERLAGLPMPIPGSAGLRTLSRAVAQCDVVIVHDALYATSIAAVLLARRQRKPVILIQHIAAIPFRSAAMRSLMALANSLVTRRMLKAADQVVFISETVRSELARFPVRRPAQLLFNGVEPALFHPGSSERATFGLPDTERLVVFAGRFVAKKGLSVIEELARLCPDITFALAGAGPIDPLLWQLTNVHCLGSLPTERLAALYRSSDVLLLPSVGEGYPLVIQEAMACGLPVICSTASQSADPMAARFLQGVQVDLADPVGTARGIAPLLAVPMAAHERSAMADYAIRTYSWPAMASGLATIARDLAG